MGDMEGRALALTRPEDSALALRRAVPSALPRRAMGDMEVSEGMATYYYEENLDKPFRVHLRDTFDFPTHLHHQVEICIQVKGEQEVSVDGRSTTLESGDAALMLPNSVHSYRLVTPGRCVVAIFDPSYAGAYMDLLQRSSCAEPFVKAAHSDILLALLRLAREENIDEMLATAYMSVAVGRLLPDVKLTERGTAVETDDLRRVLGYIGAHIDEKITLDTLSSSLYINRYSISRLFSEHMGCGLNEYVNTLRADRARSLLRDTSMPLSEVCRRSGFESERTFYRVFREQYGASPRQYGRSAALAENADKR